MDVGEWWNGEIGDFKTMQSHYKIQGDQAESQRQPHENKRKKSNEKNMSFVRGIL